MRAVIVHLAAPCTESEVADLLDREYEGQAREAWSECVDGDPCLYIEFYRHHTIEFAAEELQLLKSHFAGEIPLSVIANVSGRHDGTPQVVRFVTTLLARFSGVATDEFTEHLWLRSEIEQDFRYDGLAFFDYRGFYERVYASPNKRA
jgi:hypothetical protein